MSVLPVGFGSSGVDTGDIGHSLRLRSAASAYLSRTITTDATSTYFAAVKRGKLGVVTPIFDSSIKFNANDTLTAFGLTTTAVFRDPTSWLFIHVSNGGLYVNGVSYGAVTTSSITNPRIGYDGTNYADMYIARIGVVGGTSSAYTNFGYFNTEINEWVSKTQSAVKAVVDAGGANSFMLEFDDATSLTTLGYDKSSKGNNWTLNNFSLTAGTSYDHMLDVPGNSYATLNPLRGNSNVTHADGNLKATATGGYTTFSTIPLTAKTYIEITQGTVAALYPYIGLATAGMPSTSIVGKDATYNTWSYATDGETFKNNVAGTTRTAITAGQVVGLAFDPVTYKVWISINGTWVNSGDPAAGTGNIDTLNADEYFFAVSMNTQSQQVNFGQRPFAYTPPAGFKALCQRNLPDPAILNPELHFDVRTRTGTAAAYSVTDLLFPPDLAWIKSRGRAVDHALYDSVRGVQKQLESNQTGAETTETTGITAFNAAGYTGGALDQINGTTATNSFVDWLWKAGGAAVTNNNGSISSQVSANVLAGQSVLTYTSPNNAADQTVGHGLTSAPELIIAKNRTSATLNWDIYHKALAAGYGLKFATDASSAGRWPTTAPTSSVFSTKNTYEHNSTDTYVAYCFHSVPGYSKVGSYTGNGSTDGPFVECGFKPKYVLLKRVDSTGYWQLHDGVRNTYNALDKELYPNASDVEATTARMDFTANGFKLRDSGAQQNASGGTYIFIAFADVPGKYSLAR